MEKWSSGESSIHHDVGRKTHAQMVNGPAQQTLPGGIFAIPGSVRLDIKRQRQPGPHHTGQDHMVLIPAISSSVFRWGRQSEQPEFVHHPTVVPSTARPMPPLVSKALLRLARRSTCAKAVLVNLGSKRSVK